MSASITKVATQATGQGKAEDLRYLLASELDFQFFQHLTTVALTTLGAAVTFKGLVASAAPFDEKFLFGLSGLVAVAVMAVMGQEDVIFSLRGVKRRFVLPVVWTRRLALGAFGLSVGFLLGYFQELL